MSLSIPPLNKLESIGRGVFSGNLAKKAKRKKPVPNAFLEHITVERISVDRLDLAPLSVFIETGNKTARNRSNGNRSFYGWAVLKVKDAESENRKVESTPVENNPCHADICLLNLPDDDTRRHVQIDHAVELAACAEWWDANSES